MRLANALTERAELQTKVVRQLEARLMKPSVFSAFCRRERARFAYPLQEFAVDFF